MFKNNELKSINQLIELIADKISKKEMTFNHFLPSPVHLGRGGKEEEQTGRTAPEEERGAGCQEEYHKQGSAEEEGATEVG